MTDEMPPAGEEESLRLDQFLKLCALAESGGHAKFLVQGGNVKVNGQVETRRRRKLVHGDIVEVGGQEIQVLDSEKEGSEPPSGEDAPADD